MSGSAPFRSPARLASMLALLALVAGCALSQPGDDLLVDRVAVRGTFAADLAGRPFLFQQLEAPAVGGGIDRFLQIDGDGIVVSFHSSTPPYVPVVRANAVSFGGHDFGATATANVFEVDGRPMNLPAPGVYIFSDGQPYGRYPWP